MILRYHLEEYDILHQRSLFNEARIAVTLIRGNHYFKASKTMNQQGSHTKFLLVSIKMATLLEA